MTQISKLFVKDLVFAGTHGSTGREALDSQNFRINVEINLDISKASQSDNIADTYDYKNAVQIIRSIIERERHVLIEKIANRIADRISQDPKIKSVDVKLEKLDAGENGIPGISISKKRAPQEIDEGLFDFDLKDALEKLNKIGGVSFPILTSSYRKALLEEAETYEYHKQPEIVGPAKVREQLSSIKEFRPESLFFRLKNDFQKMLDHKLKFLTEYSFNPPLLFNEMSLQLYEKGSIGITPHMDGSSIVNLICIFVLTGSARLAICDDRAGANPKDLDTRAGNVILLRGPGFMNSDFRPFHFVSDVTERRIVFGLRQKIKKSVQ